MLRVIDGQNKRTQQVLQNILEHHLLNLHAVIPQDLKIFYSRVGHFIHPFTGKEVDTLGEHQYQAWSDRGRSRYRLYLKSQKIGLSMLFLLEDLHVALTYGRGKEILVVSQSKAKAQDHLQDLRRMLRASSIYSPFLIEDPGKDMMRDERTKVSTIYLRNPDNPRLPTKIIALGITSPGSLISFKRVCHIHMSDVTLADMTEERFAESFGGLFSRLANTNGTMVIECPPRGTSGPVYDIVNAEELKDEQGLAVDIKEGERVQGRQGFLVRRYTYQVGIDCGLITPEFIELERQRLGVLFGMYYEADFYSSDKTWFNKEHIEQVSQEATELYGSF